MSSYRSSKSQVQVAKSGIPIEPEIAQLLKSLGSSQQSAPPPIGAWRQRLYDDLILHFSETVHGYVGLANKIIPCAEMAPHVGYFPSAFYYGEVLRGVAEHVRLLSQLYASLAHTPPALDAIQGIIWSISRRVPGKPVLVPVVSSQFMYVHLNYVQGVGIIGVPPYALSGPYPDLPILWHEVAGYSVAQQKSDPTTNGLRAKAVTLQAELKKYSLGTQSSFDCYRNLYELSKSQKARVNLNITHPSNSTLASIGIAIPDHAESREYFSHDSSDPEKLTVDTDYGWQMRWLGQILEDRFGLQELDETMLLSLTEALFRAYETLDFGDDSHPPPALRLQIAREYLRGDPMSRFETTTDEIGKLSIIIAAHLLNLYPRQEAGSNPDDGVAGAVKGFVKDALLPQPPQQYELLKELMKNPAIRNAFTEFEKFKASTESVVTPSNLIWEQAGFTESERETLMSNAPCGRPEEAPTRLKHLRSIKFTATDELGPGTGQDLLLPPP